MAKNKFIQKQTLHDLRIFFLLATFRTRTHHAVVIFSPSFKRTGLLVVNVSKVIITTCIMNRHSGGLFVPGRLTARNFSITTYSVRCWSSAESKAAENRGRRFYQGIHTVRNGNFLNLLFLGSTATSNQEEIGGLSLMCRHLKFSIAYMRLGVV